MNPSDVALLLTACMGLFIGFLAAWIFRPPCSCERGELADDQTMVVVHLHKHRGEDRVVILGCEEDVEDEMDALDDAAELIHRERNRRWEREEE